MNITQIDHESDKKIYTLLSTYHIDLVTSFSSGDDKIPLEFIEPPNSPRVSLDGSLCIVTGIYDFVDASYLSQREAELLVNSEQ